MKLGITGTRQTQDCNYVWSALDDFAKTHDIELLVSGSARGVDQFAEQWAKKRGIPINSHKPDYNLYGRGAPLRRNDDIVKECDELVAFPLEDHSSRGTEYTMSIARAFGKKVTEFPVKSITF